MPLIKPLDIHTNPEVKKLAEFFNQTLGFCPNSVLTMAHRPAIAKAFIELNRSVMENHGKIDSALKRLVAYVVSFENGCRYCQSHTIRAAQRFGANEQQLQEVWQYKTSPHFTSAEKVALEFAFQSSRSPVKLTDELTEQLHLHFDEGEVVELVAVVSLFGYLNRWNDTMATALEPPARQSGEKWLAQKGWNKGKH